MHEPENGKTIDVQQKAKEAILVQTIISFNQTKNEDILKAIYGRKMLRMHL